VLELLPHGPELMLLDRVTGRPAGGIAVAVAITGASPFLVAGHGVPAHVGLEYMAQACGAFAGLQARDRALPVRVAFLLGTRRYRAVRAWFAVGETLDVEARLVLQDGPMAVFDCRIAAAGAELASAQLTVYQPDSDRPDGPPEASASGAPVSGAPASGEPA
jgi:predicted hotdog family 3-hydroxylacyl-ACP dehydratase